MGQLEKAYVNDKIKEYYNIVPAEKYEHAGVYCIKVDEEIVYVGKARDMRTRVASHMYNTLDNKNMTPGMRFKYGELRKAHQLGYQVIFDVLYTSPIVNPGKEQDDDIGKMEAELINKYLPKLNKQIPNLTNYHKYSNKEYEHLELKEKKNEGVCSLH